MISTAATAFRERRQKLYEQMGNHSMAIISAAPEIIRNGDVTYRYRQNSDFYYLTGFEEPDAVAVFVTGDSYGKGEFILFNRPRDLTSEIWHGVRAGQEGACTEYGADRAFDITDIDELLPDILAESQKVYYSIGRDEHLDMELMAWLSAVRGKVRAGVVAPNTFIDLEQIVHEMRLIKSAQEIALMRTAAEITVKAHQRAMQACRPGMMEYALEAELRYEFIRNGCLSTAYSSIVGGGKNACVLHYVANNERLNDGELVLIDAGSEYQNYASDVTRTFPVNGRFSPEQKAIYEIVLKAQLAGIHEVRPGVAWPQIQITIIRIITEGLQALGILQGNTQELMEKRAYFPFYMHNSGHWLGLDTHDVGSYKEAGQWRKLQPGMVLTVEPGIYIAANSPNVDPKWWNIGVRIEDDVVVTEDGFDVLSATLPKTVEDIEALMAV